MKKHTIPAQEVTNLVKTTTEAFDIMRQAKPYSQLKPKDMHFMADLLVELVETAYPLDKEIPKETVLSNLGVKTMVIKPSKKFDSIEELFESIGADLEKAMNHNDEDCENCGECDLK